MNQKKYDHNTLRRLTLEFTQAFNANDLNTVLSYFSETAVYDQFEGELAQGRDAIRAAFKPQFDGSFGKMEFIEEDLLIDSESGKTMISWTCALDTNRGRAGWRGLDILHFDVSGKIIAKLTYAKTKQPLLEAIS